VVSRLPAVAISAAVVAGLLAWRFGMAAGLPAFVWLGLVGVPLGFVDVALKRLPDLLTLPSYPLGLLLLGLAAPFTHDGGGRYVHALVGMAVLFLVFAVQWFAAPGQIGLGDVKLSGVLGLYLGWLGLGAWIVGVFAMFVLGGAVSLVLLVTRRATRKSTIPFGPFMLLGTLVSVLLYAS
jgi:leader peptidase (prepilin peptidase)/N-methyltransferase